MGSYSMDLQKRAAGAIDAGRALSARSPSPSVSVSSSSPDCSQWHEVAGMLVPKPRGGGPWPAPGFPGQVELAMLIAEHPDATLKQSKEWGGYACILTTFCRTLCHFRPNYKKKSLHTGERDDPQVQTRRWRYTHGTPNIFRADRVLLPMWASLSGPPVRGPRSITAFFSQR